MIWSGNQLGSHTTIGILGYRNDDDDDYVKISDFVNGQNSKNYNWNDFPYVPEGSRYSKDFS